MTRRLIICTLAALALHISRARGQAISGNVLRLVPTSTTLPTTCNTGDMRNDANDSNRVKLCRTNTWTTLLTSDGGSVDPTTTLGDMIYNDGGGQQRLAGRTAAQTFFLSQTGTGAVSAAPAWVSSLTASFVGPLTGTATFAAAATTASSSGTASTSGTAAFSAVSGTAAFSATSGTATFAATSGTASFSNVSGTASFATASTTAAQSGTAAFSNVSGTASFATASTTAASAGVAATASSINFIVGISNGGTNNNTLSVAAGGVLYTDGTRVMNAGAGSAGQFFISNGASAPSWTTAFTPQVTAFTSSTGSYTVASGVTWIRVRLVGGGGGGSGSGSAGQGNGTAGGTTFWTGNNCGNLTASGGSAGLTNGTIAAGGTAVGGFFFMAGGSGGSANGGTGGRGAMGGNSIFGGAGAGGAAGVTGSNAGVNSGSGGGGAGGNGAGVNSGAGGGAGGYTEHIISGTLPSICTWSIGVAGANGTAGTSGFVGGDGGAGIIIVEAH